MIKYVFLVSLVAAIACGAYCQPWREVQVGVSYPEVLTYIGMWLFGTIALLSGIIWMFFVWVRARLVVALALLLAGCAHPVVLPCPEPCAGDGLRFYRPDIYVLVAPDGTWRTVPLPNYDQQFVLRVEGWLGDASLNPTLTDGWNFASMSSGTNNDATLAAVAGAAGAAKGLMAGALFPHTERAPMVPGLYRFYRGRLIGPMPFGPS